MTEKALDNLNRTPVGEAVEYVQVDKDRRPVRFIRIAVRSLKSFWQPFPLIGRWVENRRIDETMSMGLRVAQNDILTMEESKEKTFPDLMAEPTINWLYRKLDTPSR